MTRSVSRRQRPRTCGGPSALLLVHGGDQTATNWMRTPDGRKAWAEYFVELGYVPVLQSRQSSIVAAMTINPCAGM
jgi:hypothetical protein